MICWYRLTRSFSHSELLNMFDNFYFQIFVRVEKVTNNVALFKAIFKIYGFLFRPLLYVTYYNI
jgi:hypothetical protein